MLLVQSRRQMLLMRYVEDPFAVPTIYILMSNSELIFAIVVNECYSSDTLLLVFIVALGALFNW